MSTTSVDASPRPPGEQSEVVLSVRDLNVRFPSEAGTVHAVRGMDFDLRPGRSSGSSASPAPGSP